MKTTEELIDIGAKAGLIVDGIVPPVELLEAREVVELVSELLQRRSYRPRETPRIGRGTGEPTFDDVYELTDPEKIRQGFISSAAVRLKAKLHALERADKRDLALQLRELFESVFGRLDNY